MNLLLFGGAPKSGKDSAAKYLYENSIYEVFFEKFSAPLKLAFAAMARKPINEYYEVEYYEDHKEEIIPWLGVSYRQFQINLSEQHIKPLYGEKFFANSFVNSIFKYKRKADTVLVSDLGFKIEEDVIYENRDKFSKVLIVNVYREGCDFSKCSRSYVNSDRLPQINITNNDSLTDYLDKIQDIFDCLHNETEAAVYKNFNEPIPQA